MGTPRARRGAVRAWAAWWLALAGLWLVLVDRIHLDELVTGAVAAAGAATVAIIVRRERVVVSLVRVAWLRRAWRPVVGLLGDLPVLVTALGRRGGGRMVRVPFRAGDLDDPERAGRRGLAVVFGSLAPATYVIDVDVESDELRAHRLRRGPGVRRDADPLELA